MDMLITGQQLDRILKMLDARLAEKGAPKVRLVVCGGAALIATRLIERTTTDVDVVALMDNNRKLIAPVPLPDYLLETAEEVAKVMRLPDGWLNNGPSRDEGGLFQMGLPQGFGERLHVCEVGAHLTIYFIDRKDQIHFKLYAATDRGGYHITDLVGLRPNEEELKQAAQWAFTHDVSPEFRLLVKRFLKNLGYENVAETV